MPSIHPGYNYDIFISYRHNDNRSGWVSEFVKALQEELASTLKDPISVYFDTNPHDGLLETHQVDKSLEGKLKCLIFLPIISQTYCDPKSFAWQHEFCAFNQLTKSDVLGRDITLKNGNVTSRILPIRIHDLDDEDKSTIEGELGNFLRAVDFTFKSAGVNRPLTPDDKREENGNKTFYRDQVNKVANAIKEIIMGVKQVGGRTIEEPNHERKVKPPSVPFAPPLANTNRNMALIALALMMLFAVLYAISQFTQSVPAEPIEEDASIAVLPFANLSNDPEQEYFSDGITEQIITNLAHINSLKVIARTSVMKFKKTEKTIKEIGKELGVTHILEGSIRKSGSRVRVTAQLITVSNEAHLWAQDYDADLKDIFTVQDEVSMAIANALQRKLTDRESEALKSERSTNVEAYQHYLKGFYLHDEVFFVKRIKEDFLRSEEEFKKAIALDSGYAMAYAGLADLYDTYRTFSARGKQERDAYGKIRDSLSAIAIRLGPDIGYVNSVRAYSFTSIDSVFKYRKKANLLSPNNTLIGDALSVNYQSMGLHYQALQLAERNVTLDPTNDQYYVTLGRILTLLGEYKKARMTLQKALLMQPDGLPQLGQWAYLAIILKDTAEAEQAIGKVKQINPETNINLLEAMLLALRGERQRALLKVEGMKTPRICEVYVVLKMHREAMDVLEKNDYPYLTLQTSFFDDLRSEPRFKKIVEKAKVRYEELLKKYAD